MKFTKSSIEYAFGSDFINQYFIAIDKPHYFVNDFFMALKVKYYLGFTNGCFVYDDPNYH